MTNVGYARVSREDQNPQYQHDALTAAGVEPQQAVDFLRRLLAALRQPLQ
jgi:DNA invertase Pin-like site-specific DNA recombinase